MGSLVPLTGLEKVKHRDMLACMPFNVAEIGDVPIGEQATDPINAPQCLKKKDVPRALSDCLVDFTSKSEHLRHGEDAQPVPQNPLLMLSYGPEPSPP